MFHTSDAVIWVYYASPSDDCHQLQTEEELTGYVLHPEGLPDDKPILILVNHKEAEAEAVKVSCSFWHYTLSALSMFLRVPNLDVEVG